VSQTWLARARLSSNTTALLSGFQPDASHPDPGKIFVGQRMQELRIKALNGETPAANLSGGNQQKVVLPKWMNQRFKAILFDEPTRGVDVGAKAEIYQLIEQRAERGTAVVVISSELLEIVGLSDRFPISLGRRLRKSSRPDGTGTYCGSFQALRARLLSLGPFLLRLAIP
jgi:ABC-type sugar transport system ATPase subunit